MELGKDSYCAYEDLMERGELTWVDHKARYSGQQGLQAVQNLDVLYSEGFFLLSTLLKVLKQGIGSSVSLALTIIDLKIVAREFLSPTDLSGAQILCLQKPTEVVVVDEYEHLMLRSF